MEKPLITPNGMSVLSALLRKLMRNDFANQVDDYYMVNRMI